VGVGYKCGVACCLQFDFGWKVNILLIWFLFKRKWLANEKETLQ